MNTKIIGIGLTLVLLIVGLSGCTQTELNEADESDKPTNVVADEIPYPPPKV